MAPRKSDLPAKDCVACRRPIVWRAKWARDWDQVKFCSERCRRAGVSDGPAGPGS
ncbi:MAG: DUF2256 domain-containing protein [Pseudomonadota bacterium]